MTGRLSFLLVLLGLLAVLVAGCGGDTRRGEAEGGETTTTPNVAPAPETSQPTSGKPQVTKVTDPVRRAYVTRVDAICRRMDPERSKERELVATSTDPAEAAKDYDGSIRVGWQELHEIEAIAEPPGDKALLSANVFDPIRTQLALKERIRDALAATDLPLLRRLRAELDNSTRALTGFARGYGFRECGEE
jgi:hypothetical protein